MMKQFLTQSVTLLILSFLSPAFLHAQLVTDERMFSFEDPQVPECIACLCDRCAVAVEQIRCTL